MTNEELCERIRAGQTELYDDLIKQNMDFVRAQAYELYRTRLFGDEVSGLTVEDLIQEGCIKLYKA
ncbi:MAG: hypothetical protein HUJ70_02350, partial [Pseudobutyrivibrio sp.]|nr:hypothetical protein [Pseudobutyrivibrio sp.]